jgi:superfamily I DNA/RNA helicase
MGGRRGCTPISAFQGANDKLPSSSCPSPNLCGEFIIADRFNALIFSILEGVHDDYLRASFDNAELRRADIEQLSEYGGNLTDILEFLAQFSLMSSTDGEPTGERNEPDDEKVTLSSIHQAKGLEWKAVFLIWLVDGQFPNGRILEADEQDMLEEERRLFYVPLTTVKDELYLTYPPDLVEEWNVGNQDPWSDEEPF